MPQPPAIHLDDFLPYLINVLARKLSDGLASQYSQRFGISISEWRVIAHLGQNGAISVREITARVAMDKVKVSRAVSRLESAGLVTKTVNPNDRRLVVLALTEAGRALLEEVTPLALAYEQKVLSRLTPAEAETFIALIRRLNMPE